MRSGKKRSEPARPLVSIITAVRNSEALLEKTILSVISQRYDNMEYIIIDGASTDGSIGIIKKYDNAINYWISEPDKGIYDAWNKGLLIAKGDWIGFLGAGDTYYEDAIENYINDILKTGEEYIEYISSKNQLISGKEKVIRTIGSRWQWKRFAKYMNVAHVGSLHHRRLFQKYGYFDPSYKICGDYEFLLRPRENLLAGYLDKVTTNMLSGGISDNKSQALREAMRAKIMTGKRNRYICTMEMWIAWAKFHGRSAAKFLGNK
jgi:glycosyltransferase involved in cell wall biosynthesis